MTRTPEELAREDIDKQLARCGWLVQDRDATEINAHLGVAIREFPMKSGHGEADYLLYAGGQAIGVIEARRSSRHEWLSRSDQSSRF